MDSITRGVGRILRDRRGVTALEYGLIAALIAVVSIGAITTIGEQASKTFDTIGKSMQKANGDESGGGGETP